MLSSQQKKLSDLLLVTQLSISNVSTTRQRRFSADAEGEISQLPESTRVEPTDGDKAVKAEGGIEECFEDQAAAIQPQQEDKHQVAAMMPDCDVEDQAAAIQPQQEDKHQVAAMMPDCDTKHHQIVCEEGIRVAQSCGVQDLRRGLNAKCYSFVPDGVGTSALNALHSIRALSRLQQLFGMWPHRSLLPSLHDWTGLNHQLKVQDRSSVKDCLVPEPMLTADVHAQRETVKPLNRHFGEYLLEPQPGIPLSVKDLSGPLEFTKQRQHLDVPSVDVPSVGLENSLKLVSGTGHGVKKDDPLHCRDDVLGKSQSFLGIYKRGFVFNYSQSTMQQANLRGMIGAKRHDSISNVGTDTLIFIHNFDSGLVHGAYQRTSDILALRSGQWKVGSGSFEWAVST
ncbi:hypothetical protein CEUSTIGMA_g10479.t1 [Chlamydomonas eustigma]|uniref:Uncharacterized protein n=1 Tax=Chlamydomonas eustigma TaxID=1157962 RepID=A0A250XJ41_9CHLO|nr:hypothetical protein CEUSTIGMA_g10479.t1 [Chlamydomonas eustigma]|eukprot:GAX83053.1 hypothetical protein CEUSTIGMA_g10479.t1 [Chlamydomonas eustigma]